MVVAGKERRRSWAKANEVRSERAGGKQRIRLGPCHFGRKPPPSSHTVISQQFSESNTRTSSSFPPRFRNGREGSQAIVPSDVVQIRLLAPYGSLTSEVRRDSPSFGLQAASALEGPCRRRVVRRICSVDGTMVICNVVGASLRRAAAAIVRPYASTQQEP